MAPVSRRAGACAEGVKMPRDRANATNSRGAPRTSASAVLPCQKQQRAELWLTGFGAWSVGLSEVFRSPERHSACSSSAAERSPLSLARPSGPGQCKVGTEMICSNRAIAASTGPRPQRDRPARLHCVFPRSPTDILSKPLPKRVVNDGTERASRLMPGCRAILLDNKPVSYRVVAKIWWGRY
jgi:hypothetical protein